MASGYMSVRGMERNIRPAQKAASERFTDLRICRSALVAGEKWSRTLPSPSFQVSLCLARLALKEVPDRRSLTRQCNRAKVGAWFRFVAFSSRFVCIL